MLPFAEFLGLSFKPKNNKKNKIDNNLNSIDGKLKINTDKNSDKLAQIEVKDANNSSIGEKLDLKLYLHKMKRFKNISFLMRDKSTMIIRAPLRTSDWKVKFVIMQNEKILRKLKERFIKKTKNNEKQEVTDITKNLTIKDWNLAFLKSDKDLLSIRENMATVEFTDLKSDIFKKNIEKFILHISKIELPKRLHYISQMYNLPFNSFRIKNVNSIWGSCSSSNNINLSSKLILLEQDLIDYVIKHELNHTKHKNHSKLFWSALDRITENKAKKLDKRLKSFQYPLKDILSSDLCNKYNRI